MENKNSLIIQHLKEKLFLNNSENMQFDTNYL